jgi:lipopolysaccharide export system permease protein
MSRLGTYLTRLFVFEAVALTSIVVFLLYLVQSLRMFDLVSAKGQDLLTLAGQAALVMPAVAVIFLYVCIGIGLARALRALQISRQLAIIHSAPRLGALFGAIATYTVIFAIFVLSLAHIFGPLADQRRYEWSASIAVDLVSRALLPHRFAEIVPGVTIVIGGRQGIGEITQFFADDQRDPERRQTFTADQALIMRTDAGYILQLTDGEIRYIDKSGAFSEVSFNRYDLSLTLFSEGIEGGGRTSIQLVNDATASGNWTDTTRLLIERTADGLRVIALCAIIAAIAMFPGTGRRRLAMPLELAALGLAFLERGVSTALQPAFLLGPMSGSFALIIAAAVIFTIRLKPFTPGLWTKAVPA